MVKLNIFIINVIFFLKKKFVFKEADYILNRIKEYKLKLAMGFYKQGMRKTEKDKETETKR